MAISIRTLQRRFDKGELVLDPPSAVLYVVQDGERIAVNVPADSVRGEWASDPSLFGWSSTWLRNMRAELTKQAQEGDQRAADILAFMPYAYAGAFSPDMLARIEAGQGESAIRAITAGVGTASARRFPFFGQSTATSPDPYANLAAETQPRESYVRVTPHVRRFGFWVMKPGAEGVRVHAFGREIDATTPAVMDAYWADQIAKMREHGVPNFQHGDDFG